MKPENILSVSSFFSAWGDRMWNFAVGLYLVKLTPGSLRLAAIYGLVLSSTAVLFAPVIGDWIDRKRRLTVIRITLVLQNILVITCALFILLLLYNVTNNSHLLKLLQAVVIIIGSAANLAGQGEKISITKDWVVVVCKGSNDLLATTNALFRRVDLSVAILAPVAVGFLMTVISDVSGIIFICSWNIVSMIAEYALLLHVYKTVPELSFKKEKGYEKIINDVENTAKDMQNENNGIVNADVKTNYVYGSISNDSENTDNNIQNATVSEVRCSTENPNAMLNFLYRFKNILSGWVVYRRQTVTLAGMSLAMLYLTVLGFNAITSGYVYTQSVSEFYISICFGLGSLFGIAGTFLFPLIRKRFGLTRTGILGFGMQLSMLLLCIASIWAPGSPSNLVPKTNTGNKLLSITFTPLLSIKADIGSTSTTTRVVNDTLLFSTMATNRFSTNTTKSGVKEPDEKSYVSVILLLAGVILSRSGLWITDLTITQLQQENVVENERGIVGGVQYSFNCILDLIHFLLTICLPKPEQFGILILISISSVICASITYAVFCFKFLRRK